MGLNHFIVLFLLGFVHSSFGKECFGCPIKLDVNDKEVHRYLSEKLQDLKNNMPTGTIYDRELELVRVKNAQKQVVSGLEYSYQFEAKGLKTKQMYDCNLTVLSQPWSGPDRVTQYSCDLLHISNGNTRLIPGEEIIIDVQQNKVLNELKHFISKEIGKFQHSEYLMVVLQYLNATKQVVEGMRIKTTVNIGITNCHVENDSGDTECQYQLQGHQVCEVQVLWKPWMNIKQLVNVQCQPLETDYLGMCAGCPIEKDPNGAFVKKYLEKTLYKLNAESHSSQKLSLVKINKATSQVINGFKLTVYFDAREVKSNKDYTCKAVIILPPSKSEEQIVEHFNCTPVSAN